MANRRTRDLTVGILFALALSILAAVVMVVGQESRLFTSKAVFRVVFPSTDGLSEGSPVKMAGVQIGVVTQVRLPTDPREKGIEVELGVDREYAERVRQDSRAALRIRQYLTGEKAVEITPGSADQAVLPKGSVIEPLRETQLLDQVGSASQNLNEITFSLKNLLAALERGEGLMGQMITDPEFGREGLEAMSGAFANMEGLTQQLRDGRGFLGRMLYDEAFASRIDDLSSAMASLATVAQRLEAQEGAIGALLRDGGSAERAMEDLSVAAANLRQFSEGLAARGGLFERLLQDEELAEQVATDLLAALAAAREILEKINRGEGTLGALVNERVVYDGLEDVVAGVNDSKFARWLLRRYQKKGIEERTENQDATAAAPPEPTGDEPR